MKIRTEIANLIHTINTKQELKVEELRCLHNRLEELKAKKRHTNQNNVDDEKVHLKEKIEMKCGEHIVSDKINTVSPHTNLFPSDRTLVTSSKSIRHAKDSSGISVFCKLYPKNQSIAPLPLSTLFLNRSKGNISRTDLRVSRLPPLSPCKKGICCSKQCNFLTNDLNLQQVSLSPFQWDIDWFLSGTKTCHTHVNFSYTIKSSPQRLRDDYCAFVRENDHKQSNHYLASFLDPTQGRFLEAVHHGRQVIPGATVACIWCQTVPGSAHREPHKCSRQSCPNWVDAQNFYMNYSSVKTFRYFLPIIDENNEKNGNGIDVCVGTFQAIYALSNDRMTAIRKIRLYQALSQDEESNHIKKRSYDDFEKKERLKNNVENFTDDWRNQILDYNMKVGNKHHLPLICSPLYQDLKRRKFLNC